MNIQQSISSQTSDQVGPRCRNTSNHHGTVKSFKINGCSVSFAPTANDTDGPIKAVKEILISTYRTSLIKR